MEHITLRDHETGVVVLSAGFMSAGGAWVSMTSSPVL